MGTREQPTNSGIVGPPLSFLVDGKQYIPVQSGWGLDARSIQARLNSLDLGLAKLVAERRSSPEVPTLSKELYNEPWLQLSRQSPTYHPSRRRVQACSGSGRRIRQPGQGRWH